MGRRWRWLVLPVAALLVSAAPVRAQAGEAADSSATAARTAEPPPLVFLVRHGETSPDGTRDPGLSEEGRRRARRLATLLADAGLNAVYTTDYLRTRGTAADVAARLGVESRVYDPRRLEAFAATLLEEAGRVLVVGHSNTTPDLVAALGGDPGPAIAEDEHDRLYVVFAGEGDTRTVLLRY